MLAYRYTHVENEGTTGLFTCLPDYAAEWPHSLSLLAERPHDQWLRSHVLAQVAALPESEKTSFLDFCSEGSPVLPAVPCPDKDFLEAFLEHCEKTGALPARQPSSGGNLTEKSKLERLCSMLNANLQRHAPLKKADLPDEWLPEPGEKPRKPGPERPAGPLDWLNPVSQSHLKELAGLALQRLSSAGLLDGGEMRHEAALSPINLVRSFRIDAMVRHGEAPYRLHGLAKAYGKGLSLAQARVSCLMEIVERCSAFPSISENGTISQMPQLGGLLHASRNELLEAGHDARFTGLQPEDDHCRFFWLPAKSASGKLAYVPAQSVFLFLNLPEQELRDEPGSTGLAAGSSIFKARLAALVETLERNANACMPHNPARCFILASKNEILQSLLEDYRSRGIHVVFEDITTENGVPAFRCFVQGEHGKLAQASAAGLNARDAAISAMLETPWPYHYSQPLQAGRKSRPSRQDLPVLCLEELPDYSLGSDEADLRIIENTLARSGFEPLYIDLTREDLLFPVVRCLVPQLEINSVFSPANPPGPRLLSHLGSIL